MDYQLLSALRHQLTKKIVEVTDVIEDDTSNSIIVVVKLEDGSKRDLQLSTDLFYATGPRLGDNWDPDREWPTKRIRLKVDVEMLVDVNTNIESADALEAVLGYDVSEAIEKAVLRVEAEDALNNHAIVVGHSKVSEDEQFPEGVQVGVEEVKPR